MTIETHTSPSSGNHKEAPSECARKKLPPPRWWRRSGRLLLAIHLLLHAALYLVAHTPQSTSLFPHADARLFVFFNELLEKRRVWDWRMLFGPRFHHQRHA